MKKQTTRENEQRAHTKKARRTRRRNTQSERKQEYATDESAETITATAAAAADIKLFLIIGFSWFHLSICANALSLHHKNDMTTWNDKWKDEPTASLLISLGWSRLSTFRLHFICHHSYLPFFILDLFYNCKSVINWWTFQISSSTINIHYWSRTIFW